MRISYPVFFLNKKKKTEKKKKRKTHNINEDRTKKLEGKVGGKSVNMVGKVLEGAGDALDLGMAAELAHGADLARHRRHRGGEGGKLLNHPVHDLADSQELAAQREHVDLDRHGLAEVALRARADDARDLGGRLVHVFDELVDREIGRASRRDRGCQYV